MYPYIPLFFVAAFIHNNADHIEFTVRYIYGHLESLGSAIDMKLSLKYLAHRFFCSEKLISANDIRNCSSGFPAHVGTRHLSVSIPIVNLNGVLIAHLSAADLRGLTAANISNLALPVLDFLQPHHKSATHQDLPKAISCTANDSLDKLLDTIVSNRIKRGELPQPFPLHGRI